MSLLPLLYLAIPTLWAATPGAAQIETHVEATHRTECLMVLRVDSETPAPFAVHPFAGDCDPELQEHLNRRLFAWGEPWRGPTPTTSDLVVAQVHRRGRTGRTRFYPAARLANARHDFAIRQDTHPDCHLSVRIDAIGRVYEAATNDRSCLAEGVVDDTMPPPPGEPSQCEVDIEARFGQSSWIRARGCPHGTRRWARHVVRGWRWLDPVGAEGTKPYRVTVLVEPKP